jgi:hypothetical protein
MIRKYFTDILCIVLFVLIAFLAAEKPVIDLNIPPSTVDKRQPQDTKKEETKKLEKEIVRDVFASEALKDRNIFSADGKYAIFIPGAGPSGTGGVLPENPYTLIGILHGEEKKAVFREYTGSILFLTVGKKLIDDSVITRIDSTSVEVKRGKEKKELKIFNVKVPILSIVRKP